MNVKGDAMENKRQHPVGLLAHLDQNHRQNPDLKGAPMLVFLVLATVSLLGIQWSLAQTPQGSLDTDSIRLGGTELTLGTTEAEALRTMKAEYVLTGPVPEGQFGHVWAASRKDNSGSSATLTFVDGLLESVDVDRGPKDELKGVEFAESAYYAIADFVKEGRKNCTLNAQLNDTATMMAKIASIGCGQKYISIHISSVKGEAPFAWVASGLAHPR
jgi:hypothetical protein